MRKTLEDLHLGNIVPNGEKLQKRTSFARALSIVEKNESYLNEKLDGNEKEALAAFIDAQAELNAITGKEGFVDGFRLGVQVTLAALSDDDGELKLIC